MGKNKSLAIAVACCLFVGVETAEPESDCKSSYSYRDSVFEARAETAESWEASSYRFLSQLWFQDTSGWGTLRAVSNQGRSFQIGRLDAVTKGKRVHRLETGSGWWVEIKDELPARYRSVDESATLFMEKYRQHMEDPYTLSIEWQEGNKASVTGLWMDVTLSVSGKALIEKVKAEGLDEKLREDAPAEVASFLKDLNDLNLCQSCGGVPNADRLLQILLPLFDESWQPREKPRRDWTQEHIGAVSYRHQDEPPAYEAARFLEDFPMADVDNYREVFIKADEKE